MLSMHCGALTTQYWLKLYAVSLPAENPTPNIPKESDRKRIIEDTSIESGIKPHYLGWLPQTNSYATRRSPLIFTRKKSGKGVYSIRIQQSLVPPAFIIKSGFAN
jgi:hypothetical protein